MATMLPQTLTFRGHTYRRVHASQTEPVYVGTIYAEEHTPYDNPAFGSGVSIGPTAPVAILVARDRLKLDKGLDMAERQLLQGLQHSPAGWDLRLVTDVKAQPLTEFTHQVRQEWTNADEIIRDLTHGKVITLENVLEEMFKPM